MILSSAGLMWCAALFASRLTAAERLYDFETEAEQRPLAVASPYGCVKCVTNEFATSGSYSYRLAYEKWLAGNWKYSAYDGVYLQVPEHLCDWSVFDRMTFDLVSESDGGDFVQVTGKDAFGNSERIEGFVLPGNTAVRHVVPLDPTKRKRLALKKMTALSLSIRTPRGCRIYIDNFQLFRPGEKIPALTVGAKGAKVVEFLQERMAEAQSKERDLARKAAHLESLFKFRTDCDKAGTVRNGLAVGKASSMTMVRPRAAFEAEPAKDFKLSLARNESESVQVVVAPTAGDLKNVRVAVSDLVCGDATFPANDIACVPVGYVKAETPGYRSHPGVVPDSGWYPDMLLSFLKGVDVKGTDVQSFWVRVKCPEGRKAGTYVGTLTVEADNATAVSVPFSVCVRSFAIGKVSPLHLELTFRPQPDLEDDEPLARKMWKDKENPVNIWKKHEDAWVDFLADYYITYGSIYLNKNGEFPIRQYKRLKEQGRLGDICLGYWNPLWADGEDIEKRFIKGYVEPIRGRYAEAKAAGLLDQSRVFIYGADEMGGTPERIARMKRSLSLLREAAPGAIVSTTGFMCRGPGGKFPPHGYGVGIPELDGIDLFIPTIGAYSVDPGWVEKARSLGKKIGYYICNNPDHPFPQMFLEVPPIESRLIVGAIAEKTRTDCFLIWSVVTWNGMSCITSGPFTDWNPRTFLTDNGDAQWFCPGPDGKPLATIRVENFRDGLEDLWYARLYEKKFGRRPEVSENLVKDLRNYSRDPKLLREWREKMADALEAK